MWRMRIDGMNSMLAIKIINPYPSASLNHFAGDDMFAPYNFTRFDVQIMLTSLHISMAKIKASFLNELLYLFCLPRAAIKSPDFSERKNRLPSVAIASVKWDVEGFSLS